VRTQRAEGARKAHAEPAIDSTLGLHSIDDYAPLVGAQAVERIVGKAEGLRAFHAVHVSSTFYGGGVTELLTPLTLMMNTLGVANGWRMIQGSRPFFASTKKLHNMLQGADGQFTDVDKAIYEQVIFENATRLHFEDCDAVIVHDPQPLPLVRSLREREPPWLWQCHVDLSSPNPSSWNYLRQFIDEYDTAIFSLPEYAQELTIEQRFITPAIDPFSVKNRELSRTDTEQFLARHGVPTDLPLVVQVSRFDRFKDPMGVIEAVRRARREVDCRLVLLGSHALDDPEGDVILETIHSSIDERVIVLTVDDPLLVNALQREATVVLQKSLREGFGLTVTEAMWKGAAVIGGNVGGIRRQIADGETGFLVDSVDQTAERIVELLKDRALRERMGRQARETVRRNFLMTRLIEDWLDLLAGFAARQPQ